MLPLQTTRCSQMKWADGWKSYAAEIEAWKIQYGNQMEE